MTTKRLFDSNRTLIMGLLPPELFELIIGVDDTLYSLNFNIKGHDCIIPIKMNAFGELGFHTDRLFLEYSASNIDFSVQFSVQQFSAQFLAPSAICWFGDDNGPEDNFMTFAVNDLEKLKTECIARQMIRIIEK